MTPKSCVLLLFLLLGCGPTGSPSPMEDPDARVVQSADARPQTDAEPAPDAAPPVGSPAYRMDLGFSHGCALDTDTGEVRCWGAGQDGRLGYANTDHIGDDEAPSSAGTVNIGGSAAELALGDRHSCALLSTGAVRCWGLATYGALGYGNVVDIGDSEDPATAGDVPLPGSATAIAAGWGFSCALLDDDSISCWGAGESGRTGRGTTDVVGDNESVATLPTFALGGSIAMIDAGAGHACALLDSGDLHCWGNGDSGQTGLGATDDLGDDELVDADNSRVDLGDESVLDVALGDNHTCALLSDGEDPAGGDVRCWGKGDLIGQPGFAGDLGDDESPASGPNVALGGRALAISAGAIHTCALLENKSVRCWGSGAYGKLGYGSTEDVGDNETPASMGSVDLGADVEVAAVEAGGAFTCVLTGDDGLRCWGNGLSGSLGTGNTDNLGDDEAIDSLSDIDLF